MKASANLALAFIDSLEHRTYELSVAKQLSASTSFEPKRQLGPDKRLA
jgi:hypothetical protein